MIKKDLESCNISLDSFTRTTDPTHYEISQNFFLKLYEKGYIYEQVIKQPYCEKCNRFLPDRYVEGKCPHCGAEGARGDHCEAWRRFLQRPVLCSVHFVLQPVIGITGKQRM